MPFVRQSPRKTVLQKANDLNELGAAVSFGALPENVPELAYKMSVDMKVSPCKSTGLGEMWLRDLDRDHDKTLDKKLKELDQFTLKVTHIVKPPPKDRWAAAITKTAHRIDTLESSTKS